MTDSLPNSTISKPIRQAWMRRAVIIPAVLVLAGLTAWLLWTPPGLLGKMHAIGYSVCHQIVGRSYTFDGQPLPLCSRCTGMYLGAFLSFLVHLPRGRRGLLPQRSILIVMGAFLVLFGIDGVNSYLHFIPSFEGLYQPQNALRLATGTTLGAGIPAMLMPVFHQSVWVRWIPERAMQGWKMFLAILVLGTLGALAVVSGNPLLTYPVAIITPLTVVAILSMCYTVLWLIILKRENTANTWSDLAPMLLAGFGTALAQIFLLDLLRFWLTQTWAGFSL